jgi:hypothetical protein
MRRDKVEAGKSRRSAAREKLRVFTTSTKRAMSLRLGSTTIPKMKY